MRVKVERCQKSAGAERRLMDRGSHMEGTDGEKAITGCWRYVKVCAFNFVHVTCLFVHYLFRVRLVLRDTRDHTAHAKCCQSET